MYDLSMNEIKKRPLVLGTLILTISGILSRLIGFLYKIFLSRTIGAAQLGLYHLTFPVITLFYSVSSAGIQTALSRYIAQCKNEKGRRLFLLAGVLSSLALCIVFGLLLFLQSDWIAIHLLGDIRCGMLLKILSYSLIPTGIHACFNGFYYGKKKTAIPAVSQLSEQVVRVLSVYIFYQIMLAENTMITARHAAWGVMLGECAGLLVSLTAYLLQRNRIVSATLHAPNADSTSSDEQLSFFMVQSTLWSMALPLTCNQALTHIFAAIENMMIPQKLAASGLGYDTALSIYGVLSGMVMSVIFFPCVLTGSLSVVLMPTVSEDYANGHLLKIQKTIKKALFLGLVLGFICTILFLITGPFIGTFLFDNELSGVLIQKLSWICPLAFVYSLLCSILHGIGKAKTVLGINLLSSLIRIGSLYFLVPDYGLHAVLWGMILSAFFAACASYFALRA